MLTIFLSHVAQAADGKSVGLSTGVYAMYGAGKMGNGDLNNLSPDAKVQFSPFGFFLAYNIKKIRIGINYEYVYANQTTSPSEVNYTNTSGNEQSSGIKLDYYNGKFSFGIIYKLNQSYKLTQKTGTGIESQYSSNNSFSLQTSIQIRKRLGLLLDYSQANYTDSLPDASVKMNRVSIGLIFSNFVMVK